MEILFSLLDNPKINFYSVKGVSDLYLFITLGCCCITYIRSYVTVMVQKNIKDFFFN